MNLAKETYKLDRGTGQSFKADARRRPEPDYKKNLLQVYADFVHWVISETGSIDILCRHWAHPEKKQEHVYYPSLVTLPTWIQTVEEIGEGSTMASGYGKQGDSFVGIPGFQGYSSYNASHNMKADVSFAAGLLVSQRSSRSRLNPQATTKPIPPSTTTDGATYPAPQIARIDPLVNKVASIPKPNALNTFSEVVLAAKAAKRKADDAFPDEAPTKKKTAGGRSVLLSTDDEAGEASDENQYAPTPPLPPAPTDSTSPTETEGLGNTASALRWLKETGKDASIRIKGIRIAQITWATDPILDGVLPPQVLKTLGGENWQHPSDDALNDKLWRSLLADRGSDGHNPPPLSEMAFEYIRKNCVSNGLINTDKIMTRTRPPMDIVRPFLKRVQGVIWDRCFFRRRSAWGAERPRQATTARIWA